MVHMSEVSQAVVHQQPGPAPTTLQQKHCRPSGHAPGTPSPQGGPASRSDAPESGEPESGAAESIGPASTALASAPLEASRPPLSIVPPSMPGSLPPPQAAISKPIAKLVRMWTSKQVDGPSI